MVRRQRDDLDRLWAIKHAARPGPACRPGTAGLLRHGRYALHIALGHIALDWCQAIQALAAIAETVEERRDIDNRVLDQGRGDLLRLERLDEGSGQCQLLDTKAGIDGLDTGAEQFGELGRIARRLGHADADRLKRVVDTVDDKVGTAHAQSARLQMLTKLAGKLADIAGDCLGGRNRLGK